MTIIKDTSNLRNERVTIIKSRSSLVQGEVQGECNNTTLHISILPAVVASQGEL